MTAKLTVKYDFSSDPDDDFGGLAVSVQTNSFYTATFADQLKAVMNRQRVDATLLGRNVG